MVRILPQLLTGIKTKSGWRAKGDDFNASQRNSNWSLHRGTGYNFMNPIWVGTKVIRWKRQVDCHDFRFWCIYKYTYDMCSKSGLMMICYNPSKDLD